MAIYKPVKARWPVALGAAIAGLLVGLAAGLMLAAARPPDPVEDLRFVRSRLVEASGVLEIAEVEYEESVEGGRVVSEPEYEGARSALDRSRSRYEEVRGAVSLIDRDAAERIDAGYETIEDMVSKRADEARVSAALGELSSALEQVVGA